MHELRTINAVLRTKDVDALFGGKLDPFFTDFGDVWQGIKDYYNKHRELPHSSVVRETFPHFKMVECDGAVDHYGEALMAFYLKNRGQQIALGASGEFGKAPAEEVIDEMMSALQQLRGLSITATDHNIMDLDAAEERYAKVRERVKAMGGVPGVQSGVETIDSAYPTGFAGGDLIVCLGYTGRAKSYFTALLACNAYMAGYKPMYVSLEMGPDKVQDRMFTILGSGLFQNSGLALGDIKGDNFNTFRQQLDGKGDMIVINGDGRAEITPNVIQSKIDQHKPDMIILDYAQLMSDNEHSGDMTARMRNLSKQFKTLAVANDIPIILISSATSDGKVGTEAPTVEQVAWSKQLAFDADLAFAVHKHDDASDLIDIVCRKNRNGSQFATTLDWDINNGTWKELFI